MHRSISTIWPTPNGWKISIMLEECGLPYTVIPVNIAHGDQFKPEFLAISPNNRMPAIVDHDGPGGRPISVFESGAILQYLGRKTGKFYPDDERAPGRGRSVAVLADGQSRPEGRGGEPLPQLCAGAAALRHRALHQRDEPDLRRDEPAARGPRRSSPATIRSPTWRASAGSSLAERSARTSRLSRMSGAGSRRLLARPAVDRGIHLRGSRRPVRGRRQGSEGAGGCCSSARAVTAKYGQDHHSNFRLIVRSLGRAVGAVGSARNPRFDGTHG